MIFVLYVCLMNIRDDVLMLTVCMHPPSCETHLHPADRWTSTPRNKSRILHILYLVSFRLTAYHPARHSCYTYRTHSHLTLTMPTNGASDAIPLLSSMTNNAGPSRPHSRGTSIERARKVRLPDDAELGSGRSTPSGLHSRRSGEHEDRSVCMSIHLICWFGWIVS